MAFPWTVLSILFTIFVSSQCQGCNQTLRQESGTFTSPGFPKNYTDGTLCNWTIEADLDNVVSLYFLDFQLESHPFCSGDYVKVYDGSQSEDLLLGTYCGSSWPSIHVRSTGNTMSVVFRTDESGTDRGFYAIYNSQGFNKTLSQPSGTFASPGFPQYYKDYTLCSWTIEVQPNHVISLSFGDFELEICTNCRCDFVKVYDGSESEDLLLGTYCTTIPSTVRSTGNAMYIVFRTDHSVTHKGFSAAYQSQDCAKGWYGPNCVQCSQGCVNNDCHTVTGTCTYGCINGYTGVKCEDCIKGRYGPNCTQECSEGCANIECDRVTGNCLHGCLDGYTGDKCNDCVDGRYGSDCSLTCPINCSPAHCQRATGYCTGCVDGYYGNKCENRCNQNCKDRVCNQASGVCSDGCIDGYVPPVCEDACPKGMYGPACGLTCSPNCEGGECNSVNGHCTLGCTDVYIGDMCDIVCDSGTYGTGCQYNCSQNCKDGDCHPRTGQCDGCIDGYTGDMCGDACKAGNYGPSCSKTCSIHCFINITDFMACHHETGACPQGCVKGYTGERCESEISEDTSDTLVMGVGIGVGAMVVLGIIIVVGVCCYRRRSSPAGKTTKPQDYETKMDGREENSYTEMHTSDARYNLPTDAPSETVYQNVNAETNRDTALYANADAVADGNPYEEITEGDAGNTDVFRTTPVSTERSGSGVYVNVGMRK